MKWTITSLKVTGYIDARDFRCLRDEVRNLSELDLSSVSINEYTGDSGTSSATLYPANWMPGSSFFSSITGGKTSLKTVILPLNISTIPSMDFYGCSGLSSITIPNSVTIIGGDVFMGCSSLTSITIPNSVLFIGDGAFSSCSGLKNLTIGNGVTTIGALAFGFCTNLTSIIIPNSVTKICSYAFSNCVKLETLNIPNSVEIIESNAFQNCSTLTNVTIGSRVSTIGNTAFQGCISLKTIHSLNTTPPVLGSSVFDNSYLSVTNVYVPTLSVNTYKSTIGWSYYFFPIISADNSLADVQELTNCRIKVNTTVSGIVIDGTVIGETVNLYTLNGKQIQTIMSKGERLYLPAERNTIYLVKTGVKIFKVIL